MFFICMICLSYMFYKDIQCQIGEKTEDKTISQTVEITTFKTLKCGTVIPIDTFYQEINPIIN